MLGLSLQTMITRGKMRLMAQICVIKTTQGKNPKKFSEFYAKFDKFCYNYAVFK